MVEDKAAPVDEDAPEPAAERVTLDGTLTSALDYLAALIEENPRTSAKQALAALQEDAENVPASSKSSTEDSESFDGLIVADDGSTLSWQGTDYVRGKASGGDLAEVVEWLNEKPLQNLSRGRLATLIQRRAQEG